MVRLRGDKIETDLRLRLKLLLPCLVAFALLRSGEGEAIIVAEQTPKGSLGLGMASLYRQQPDQTREQRYRYDLLSLERILPWLRWENRLSLAPDTRPRSRSLQVQEDIYDIYTGLRVSYPLFFRLSFSLGPLLQFTRTEASLSIDRKAKQGHTDWRTDWLAQISLDYAFNRDWELISFAGYQPRAAAAKIDYFFGVALVLNSSVRGGGESADATADPAKDPGERLIDPAPPVNSKSSPMEGPASPAP